MSAPRGGGHRYGWRKAVMAVSVFALSGVLAACNPSPGGPKNDLSAMQTVRITIGEHAFEVWLADDFDTRQIGLMNTTEAEIAPVGDAGQNGTTYRGMLFVFDFEQPLGFWMLNTIIPLDIAYIRSDGEIVRTYTMAPLETRTYPSGEPARFALEVPAGTFQTLGIGVGDQVEIPDSVLKSRR